MKTPQLVLAIALGLLLSLTTFAALGCSVREFGAKGDGRTLDAAAVNVAIAADPPAPGESGGYDPAESNDWNMYQDFGHSHWHNSLIWGENLGDRGMDLRTLVPDARHAVVLDDVAGARFADVRLTAQPCQPVWSLTGVTGYHARSVTALADGELPAISTRTRR